MKVLIVGAGYVGAEICSQLMRINCEPVPTARQARTLPVVGLPTLSLDVLRPDTFTCIPNDIDAIVYAVSASGRSIDAYQAAYHDGLMNLLSYAGDSISSRLTWILVSSTGVYAEDSGDWVSEESELVSLPHPSAYIRAGEHALLSSAFQRTLVLRCSGIYGPGREYLRQRALALKAGEETTCHWTNRIHRDDVAGAVVHFLRSPNTGVFTVSDTLPAPRIDVYNFLRVAADKPALELPQGLPETGKRCDVTRLRRSGFLWQFPTYREGYGAI